MKWIIYIALFLFPAIGFGQARSWTTGTYGNGSQQAWFYKPPGYDSRTNWPVVIFLHGQGESGTDINAVDNTGLAEQLAVGMDLPAVVICPQLQTGGAGQWTAAITQLAYNHVISNYNVDVNKVYITGLSLGGSGSAIYTRANAKNIAAFIPVSGSNYGTTAAEYDSLAKVPVFMQHGFQDGTQDASNAYTLANNLYPRDPTILPQLETYWAQGHSQAVWDVQVYEKFNTKFMPWLLLHDKRPDSTAKYYVDSTERTGTVRDKWVMYWKSLRVVNSLSASAHKTALLDRLATVKNTIYGTGYKRVLIDLAVAGKASQTGVVNATNGATGQSYANMVDESNVASGWTFSVTTAPISGVEEVSFGDSVSIFGGVPANLYDDSWDIYNSPNSGSWRLSGLNNAKQYTIRMMGSASGSAISYTYQTGMIATIGATSDTMQNQIYNLVDFLEFRNVTPSSGQINIALKSFIQFGHGFIGWIEVVEQGDQQSGGNTLPNVNAGNDQSIRLPATLTLSGTASDPDGTISSLLWTQVSGPNTATITSPTIATTTVTNIVTGTYVFRLQAIDNSGGISTDDIQVTVLPAFHIPPTVTSNNAFIQTSSVNLVASYQVFSKPLMEIRWTKFQAPSNPVRRITVVGSSTSAGFGLPTDSMYVNRLKKFYKDRGVIDTIYNLAVSATNVFALNTQNALNKGAAVLLVNFPSNGYEGNTYTVTQICQRFQQIADSCAAAGVQFYTTGTQPREDFNITDRTKLKTINDSMRIRFGTRFIDFNSIVQDSVNFLIKGEYSQGDGLHINAAGHERFMQAVVARGLFQNLVTSQSVITAPSNASTQVTSLTDGTHHFLVSVLDSSGFAANWVDTVVVQTVDPPCQGVRRTITGLGGYNSLDLSYVNPGDTVVIPAGSYGYTEFKNLNGTDKCPIVIINSGGQVVFEAMNIEFPGNNIIVNGRGHAGTPYGFRVANSSYFGMHIKCQGPIEVFNVEIHNVQLGIQVKYGDTYPAELTYHRNISLHNLYIHDITGNEGIYIGSSSSLSYPKIDTVRVYDVLIDSTAREGMQISNAQQVLVERVKIIDPSFLNSATQNHGFNMGWDTEGTARDMYIQTPPGYAVFFNGGRVTFECSTIEHINRGFATSLAIFGKNFEFNDPLWDEPYQQFTFRNIHIINSGGVDIISTTAYGPLQSNIVENIKITGGTQPPFQWGPASPAPSVTNVASGAVLTCNPPTRTTMWTPDWPATSPTTGIRRLIKREY